MIPNTVTGLVAKYRNGEYLEVAGWNADGDALVVSGKQLFPATMQAGFIGLKQDEDRVMQVMPAQGWKVTFNTGQPDETTRPLAGWGLCADGMVRPLDTDWEGWVEVLSTSSHAGFQIVPPVADQ